VVFRLSLFVNFGNRLFTVLLLFCLKPLVLLLNAIDRKLDLFFLLGQLIEIWVCEFI